MDWTLEQDRKAELGAMYRRVGLKYKDFSHISQDFEPQDTDGHNYFAASNLGLLFPCAFDPGILRCGHGDDCCMTKGSAI